MLDVDVYVLCRRERNLVEAFLESYADPDEIAREYPISRQRPDHDGLAIVLDPPLPSDAHEVPVRSMREAIDLGLTHPDWAFVLYLPAAGASPTDQCCVAFTRDGHVVLGLDLVDPGSAADDGQEVDPVPVLERLVAELDARAGFIGWEVTPFGTAQEFEEMLEGRRTAGVGDVRLELPRWLRGRWLTPEPL